MNSLVCPSLGWLMRSGEVGKEIAEVTLGERFRIEQGIEIGRRARELYTNGVLVNEGDIGSAAKKTMDLMNDPNVSVIYEGTFLTGGFAAKADVMKRRKDSWQLVEVKSSVNDKAEFIDDLAYTFMVIGRSDINLSKALLLLVSKDFRLGMTNEKLFVELDHTDEVQDRVVAFEPYWVPVEEETRSPVKPVPTLRFECRGCALFKECLGKDIDNHIFEIPRLTQSKFDELAKSGIVRIQDIPDGFPLTEKQERVKCCVQTRKIFVEKGLGDELKSIPWPAYYLDFETAMTAIPLYVNIAPYTQLPTQYSIHKCSALGHVVDHFEYLADPSRDCRRDLAEHLIDDLNSKGSIIVYSSFEKTIVSGLGKTYPDLLKELSFNIDRMVDLAAIIGKHFYHPDFHGSFSIKTTLPILAPEMSYSDLEIADGDSAMATFAYLALGKFKTDEVEPAKRNLLEYCKRDSLALVKLHEQLTKYTV